MLACFVLREVSLSQRASVQLLMFSEGSFKGPMADKKRPGIYKVVK